MAKQQKETIRYSISFKQKVVKEIEEEGLSMSLAARRYGIRGGSTIHKWIKAFGKNHLLNKIVRVEMKGEKDRVKELEAEIKKLKIALADKTMEKDVLETLIDIVNEHYETDIKKNFGQKPSGGVMNKKGYAIEKLCSCFNYSRSGYYKSLEMHTATQLREEVVIELVQNIRRFQPQIGGKKMYKLLRDDLDRLECSLGRDKFFDILRRRQLLVKRRRKYVTTTDSYHKFYKYKNKLKGKELTGPNQAFVSDITYLRAGGSFVYLFLQTDAWSRKITGWHLSDSLKIEGAIKALKMTLRQCSNPKGSIHHSDRGIQYCCKKYVSMLRRRKMIISMTEENHCYENGMAERVNGILKQEFLLDERFADHATALKAVKEAIEIYNTRRPHWALNLCTPQQLHQAA